MHIVLCLDMRNGRLFNNRRQSSDRCMREDLMTIVGDGTLWMDSYTAKQFTRLPNIRVSDTCQEEMGEQDICFAERGDLLPLLCKASRLTVYRWDKVYPADSFLDAEALNAFSVTEKSEFAGYSHDHITREVYVRDK